MINSKTNPNAQALYDKFKAIDPVGIDKMMAMANKTANFNESEVAGFLAGTFVRVLNQEIVDGYNNDQDEWGSVFVDEVWANGIKEFFNQSLFEVSDYVENADIAMKDFNPASNTISSYVASCDIEKYLSYIVYLKSFINNFTSPANIFAYMAGRVNQAKKTWSYYLTTIRTNTLLQTTDKSMAITFDKVINTNGMTIDAKIIDAMRLYILNLNTPDSDHLATPDPKIVYQAKPEDLIMVLDTNFFVRMSREASTLFNKDEVLLKPKKFFWNFDKYLGADRKGKVVGYILDKKAFRNGIQYQIDGAVKLPRFRMLMEGAYKHTLLRVKKLAICKIEDTGTGTRTVKKVSKKPKKVAKMDIGNTVPSPKETVSSVDKLKKIGNEAP